MRRLLAAVIAVLILAACVASAIPSGPRPGTPSASPFVLPRTVTAAPSPSLPPSPSGEVRWERLGTIRSDIGAIGAEVVGFDDGYVVVGTPGTMVFSANGATWETVPLPVSEGTAIGAVAAAGDGSRVVAVGGYTPCALAAWQENPFGKCRERPMTWTSDDGRTWRSSASWTGPVGPEGKGGSEFSAIWPVPNGGWDVAQIFNQNDESDELDPTGPALWHSEDGRTWRQLSPDLGGLESDCEFWDAAGFWAVADSQGRRVALLPCEGDDHFLATSTDGARYEGIAEFPGAGGWARSGLAPVDSGPWLFAGGRQASIGDDDHGSDGDDDDAVFDWPEPVLWSSSDLQVWTTIVMPVPARSEALALTVSYGDHGFLAGGQTLAGSRPGEALTWASDEGADWRLANVGSRDELAIEAIAMGPAGTLAFGSVRESGDVVRLDVWKLEQLP